MLIHTTQYGATKGRKVVLSVPNDANVPEEIVQGVYWPSFTLAVLNVMCIVFNTYVIISGNSRLLALNFGAIMLNVLAATVCTSRSHAVGSFKTQRMLKQLRQRKDVLDLSLGAESRSLIREIPGMTERYPELQDLSSGFKEADERLVRAVLLDPIARDACALLAEDVHGKLTAIAKADLCAEIQKASADVGEAEALEDKVNLRAFRITGKDPFRQELEE